MLKLFSFQFPAMGTICILHLYSSDYEKANAVSGSAIAEIYRIEKRYSRFNANSYISQINLISEHSGSIEVDEETAGLLDYAYACYEKSGGLFDITSGVFRKAWDFSSEFVPNQRAIELLLPRVGLDKILWESPSLTFTIPGMELDFGGIGKEYAADRAAAICVEMGTEYGLVDLGGDISVIGPHPDHKPWNIKIRHPRNSDSFMATIDVERGAIATSGDYERFMEVQGKRYCHLLNPLTGWPMEGLSSVSVLADQCLVAGSVSTIAMLKGVDGIQWLKDMGVQYGCMDGDGRQEGTSLFHPFGPKLSG